VRFLKGAVCVSPVEHSDSHRIYGIYYGYQNFPAVNRYTAFIFGGQ